MNIINFLLFPLLGVLIGGITATLLMSLVRSFVIQSLRQSLIEQLRTIDVTNQLSSVVQEKMTVVIERFIQKIPMAELFLTSEIKQTIAQLADEEIVQAWPILRDSIGQQVITKLVISPLRLTRTVPLFGAAIGLTVAIALLIARLIFP